jgi:ABC-type multidrug transport system ATPase subunit
MGGSGWIFQDVDLTVAPGALAAVVGPAGSGRSSLLLALAGRLQPTSGTLTVLGHDRAVDAAGVRDLTSVARVAGVIGPEPALTVRESIDERCLIEDVAPAEGHRRFERACTVLQFTPDPAVLVESVVGERGTLLALALASVRTSAVIVLDDLDRDIPPPGRRALAQAVARLAATGPAIVVTATDRSAVPGADPIVDLLPPAGRPAWTFDPAAPTEEAR